MKKFSAVGKILLVCVVVGGMGFSHFSLAESKAGKVEVTQIEESSDVAVYESDASGSSIFG